MFPLYINKYILNICYIVSISNYQLDYDIKTKGQLDFILRYTNSITMILNLNLPPA